MFKVRSVVAVCFVSFLFAGFAGPASAAPLAATASIADGTAFRGTEKTFDFTVNGTSTRPVGSVQIMRSSKAWTVTGCPSAPVGWKAILKAPGACRYNSAKGAADNITNGNSGAFQLSAKTKRGDSDKATTWIVKVDKESKYNGGKDARKASAATLNGLDTKAYVWELVNSVVTTTPPTVGDACPADNKTAPAGAVVNITLCGSSHAKSSLTPKAADSSLAGSFVDTPGTFSSASVATGTNIVLANYATTTTHSPAASGLTVVAKIGSSGTSTSPTTTFTGFSTFSDTTAPTTGTVDDGPDLADIDQQATSTVMESSWTGFTDTGSGIASYEYNLSTTNACTGDVVATKNVGLATSHTESGLTLLGDQIYFNCVRATDGAGNTTSFVPSDGVLIKPLAFSPDSISVQPVIGDGMSDLYNTGDVSCTVSFTVDDSTDFSVSPPGPVVVAPGQHPTVTVSSMVTAVGKSTTVHATSPTCGSATLAVTD